MLLPRSSQRIDGIFIAVALFVSLASFTPSHSSSLAMFPYFIHAVMGNIQSDTALV